MPSLPALARGAAASLSAALLAAGCAFASLPGAGDARPAAHVRHVVLISIDGLRPDAIEAAGAATLRGLVRQGAYTLEASTISPSKTLPSHTSMLTGVGPAKHGITWNEDRVGETGRVGVPTVFDLADSAGLDAAAFFGKAKFRHLMVPGTLDYAQAPTGWWGRWSARRTAYDVRAYLERTARAGGPPHLLFVHLGEPDYAGHAVGWMSWLYGRAVRTADEALAVVLAAADAAYGRGGYTLILTADHGGHRRTHGSADSLDVTIPWVAWGQSVVPGPALGSGIRTMDTGATALWLLGVPVPPAWVGRPVAAAFRAPGAPAEAR